MKRIEFENGNSMEFTEHEEEKAYLAVDKSMYICEPGSTISCDHPDQLNEPESDYSLHCKGCKALLAFAFLPLFVQGGRLKVKCPVCNYITDLRIIDGSRVVPA